MKSQQNPSGLIYNAFLDDLCKKITVEWRGLYHNGKLRTLPYNDGEGEIFNEWLGSSARDLIADMENHIKGTWGLDWELYPFGRGGATIAPSFPSMREYSNKRLDIESILWIYYDEDDIETLKDNINKAMAFHGALKFINETVRAAVSGIEGSWNEYKQEFPELFGE